MNTRRKQIQDCQQLAQKKYMQLEAAIARGQNEAAMGITEEISMLHAHISKLILAMMQGDEQ